MNHNHNTDKKEDGSGSVYTCPMHPAVQQNRPGICPECGMNLVPGKASKKTNDKHAGHQTQSFLRKFWMVLVLTVPILIYSELFEKVFGFQAPDFAGRPLIILALGSIIFFYGGWVFVVGAYRELRAKLPGMMTLIALAITAAYAFSVFQIIRGEPHNLFWELSTLIAVMLLGHWIEMKAVQGAQGALKELAKLMPDTAEIIRGYATVIIPLSELQVGDIMLIKPGSKVPADGKIIDGISELNEAIVTGESKPASKKVGDEVIAGSINGDGTIKVEVIKIGEHTFLAGVMRLVAEAQASKSRLQILSDRAALYLTVVAVVASSITFVVWILVGAGFVFAIERLVAVLVIACPHALGLAVPLVASISTRMAAKNGLLVKQRLALEAARNINVVLFDKTGTLTRGEFGIDTIIPADGENEEKVIELAASVNNYSEHPLAKAIVSEAKKRNIVLADIKEFTRIAGKGAQGIVSGREVLVGNEALLKEKQIILSPSYQEKIAVLSKQGKTVIYVIAENKFIGSVALVDIIRVIHAVANHRNLHSLGL